MRGCLLMQSTVKYYNFTVQNEMEMLCMCKCVPDGYCCVSDGDRRSGRIKRVNRPPQVYKSLIWRQGQYIYINMSDKAPRRGRDFDWKSLNNAISKHVLRLMVSKKLKPTMRNLFGFKSEFYIWL